MSIQIGSGTLERGGVVLETSGGTKYAVFLDNSSSKFLKIYKNIDGTPSQVASVDPYDIFAGMGDYIKGLDAAIDSDGKIHIVCAGQLESLNRDIAYRVFSTSTDSWEGTGWEEAATYDNADPIQPGCAISLKSDNTVCILYVNNVAKQGTDCDAIYYVEGTSGSWGTPEEVAGPSTKNTHHQQPRCTACAANDVEAFYCYFDGSDTVPEYCRRNGTWGTEYAYTQTFLYELGGLIATTSDAIYRYHPYAFIYENGVSTGFQYTSVYSRFSSCLVNDSDRYVFYIYQNDVCLISNTGSGWTDEGTLQAGNFFRVNCEWAYNFENQSGEINYIFDDGTDVYYDSFSLGASSQDIINVGNIATVETHGTAQFNLNITGVGNINTAEAFGSPVITHIQTISGAGAITSVEVFGNPQLNFGIYVSGVPPEEAFGTPNFTIYVLPSGIDSAESFGSAKLTIYILPSGIGTSEVFGSFTLDLKIYIDGIASAEVFGDTTVTTGGETQNITGTGAIVSTEAFGTLVLDLTIYSNGIATVEVFGTAKFNLNITSAGGTASVEVFGSAIVSIPQKARPDSDVSLGYWTDEGDGTTDIYQSIDEASPNDADYIKSSFKPSNDTSEYGLSNIVDPQVGSGHIVRYRYHKNNAGGNQINLTVKMMQGSTEIASWTHPDIGENPATAEKTLTQEQADSITDYADLRLRFIAVEV
jgi:hypothetical protein